MSPRESFSPRDASLLTSLRKKEVYEGGEEWIGRGS
jgi:hypothetical protein